jgi:NADH-quinone oxidoreductase subunit G
MARLLGLLERASIFHIIIVPSKTNSLGVSLICELDDESDGYSVGYNANGDFKLTSIGAKSDNELDMPALNQQEGTIVNLDKRVVPLNAAVDYNGYSLGDLANSLGLEFEYVVDLTQELPVDKGFKTIDFDGLPNEFTAGGKENRGYLLDITTCNFNDDIEKISALDKISKNVVYRCNPIKQFNEFTAKSTILAKDPMPNGGWSDTMYVSNEFLVANSLADGDKVKLTSGDKEEILTLLKGDKIDGKIGLVPNFQGSNLFEKTDYRFKEVVIEKIENKDLSDG